MIYTNFGNDPKDDYVVQSRLKGMKSVTEWTGKDENAIFYYDRHDQAIRLIEFKDFLLDEQWEYFKTNEESVIIINFADDYINQVDLDRFANDIKERDVDNSRVVFVAMDENFQNFIIEGLKERGVNNIKAEYINILMKRVPPRYTEPKETTHKFSVFSRNYYPWRLSIFLELLNRGVLENTNYSFHNYNPYNEDVTFPLSTVKEHVLQEGYELTPKVGKWINKVPYDLGNKEQKWSNVVYDALESSDIHIVIESHFDPFLGPNFEWAKKTYNAKNISPGFITEKVWKAVSCKKPFILAATPYILRDFKKLGYKTFDGFIDESYDEIEDDKLRLKALVTEVERINNLPSEEYQQLLEGVKEIVNYNHSLYIKQWESVNFSKYPFLHGVVVL